jgi:ankyrin repeat protein
MTPLHIAAAAGDADTLRRLLPDQPDIDNRTILSGFTPLHIAAATTASDSHDRQQIIHLLYKAGADLEARTYDKAYTPLHLAAFCNRLAGVAALLECGADLAAQDATGATALHIAARHGYQELAGMLVEAGADPHRVDRQGATPLTLARDNGHAAIVQTLEMATQSAATPGGMAANA